MMALLMLASVTGFPACQRSGEPDTSGAKESSVGGEASTLVEDYLELADAAGAENNGVDEQFVADALRKLAAALGTLKLADLDVQVSLRVAAEHVLSNPESPDTTVAVRNSLVSAAGAIEAGQPAATDLRKAGESLRPDRPLSEQFAAFRDFIRKSGPPIRHAAES
jgi:hypothetical protein